jgi:hypothetical protein
VKLPSEQRSDRTKSVQVTSYEIQQRNDDAIEFGASLERVSVATGSGKCSVGYEYTGRFSHRGQTPRVEAPGDRQERAGEYTPFSPHSDIRNVVSTLPFFYYRDRVGFFITARWQIECLQTRRESVNI